ncbi:hypothetical protein [Microscilla marina]|nr:hypothetical protein [Microscilla marina]
MKTRKRFRIPGRTVFDRDLEQHQVILDMGKIHEGLLKVTHEQLGSTWLPISVVRNIEPLSTKNYIIEVNRDYWKDIFWMS